MFRYLSRLWAVVALTGLFCSAVLPLFGGLHAVSDVVGIEDHAERESHHAVHQFEIVRPAHGDDHCAVCHLQRAMSGAADDAKRYVDASDTTPWSVGTVQPATRRLAGRSLPPRAPPSFLL